MYFTKRCIALLMTMAITFGVTCIPAMAASEEPSIDITTQNSADVYVGFDYTSKNDKTLASSENVKVGSRFWELFFGSEKPKSLIVSGDVFGVKIKQSYASIVDSPGVPSLKCGDYIITVNNKDVHSAKEIKDIVNASNGEPISIEAMRGKEIIRLVLVPKLENKEYQLGITLRDVAAGIGTITFINPETGDFGGLGHGICDSESGHVIEMISGEAMEVVLGGIHKGESGNPGELSGVMTDIKIGSICSNTEVGVFGKISKENLEEFGTIYEIAKKNEVKPGEAEIISTIKNGKKARYKIEIYDIDQSSTGSKSFKIRVTDPALTAITGGIIRGMSGSPIIQNGKLIGSVTHVLVNDPTTGYGIFIENMLNAVSTAQKKAA